MGAYRIQSPLSPKSTTPPLIGGGANFKPTGDADFDDYAKQIYSEFDKKKADFLRRAKTVDPKITSLKLGGSYGRGTPKPTSDVDLLFTYKGTPPEDLYEQLLETFMIGDGFADVGIVPGKK